MNNVLLLTAEEKEAFSMLPETLREGWVTKEQAALASETDAQLILRLKMARFNDPTLRGIAENLVRDMSPSALEKTVGSIDISKLSQEQVAELFFVLGIRFLSALVVSLLTKAKTDEDLEGVAGLTKIRTFLSEANSSHS